VFLKLGYYLRINSVYNRYTLRAYTEVTRKDYGAYTEEQRLQPYFKGVPWGLGS